MKADLPVPEIEVPKDSGALSVGTGVELPAVEPEALEPESAVIPDEPPAPPTPIKRQTLAQKLEFELNNLDIASNHEVERHQRLLRPDMIQALIEYRPFSVEEFHTMVPSFLRRSIHVSEMQHLETVVGLIKEMCDKDRDD